MATNDKPVKFLVQLEGQDEVVKVHEPGLSVLVAFEKHFGLPASVLDAETEPVLDDEGQQVLDDEGEPQVRIVSEFRLEWICFLVWRQLVRQGELPEGTPFDDDFLDRIEDVEMVGAEKEDAGLDPSVPAPPTE